MSARHSAGGRARQAQIKAVLGENGYRRYQQALGRAGGVARQAQLRTALGEAGYCAHQRSLYQRGVVSPMIWSTHNVSLELRPARPGSHPAGRVKTP